MDAASTPSHSAAFPLMGVVWERLGTEKLSAVSQALGKDDSWARKVRNKECGVLIDEIPRLLAALDLKIVDRAKVCIDRDIAEAMGVMQQKLSRHIPKLIFEDAE